MTLGVVWCSIASAREREYSTGHDRHGKVGRFTLAWLHSSMAAYIDRAPTKGTAEPIVKAIYGIWKCSYITSRTWSNKPLAKGPSPVLNTIH